MDFKDLHFDKNNYFSVGIEVESGKYYLSIPVSNQRVDYEEYYEIEKLQAESYPSNLTELCQIAESCRSRKNDSKLFIKPGDDRGTSL